MLNMFEARKILCMPSAKYLELLLSCIPHTPTAATLSNPMNLGKTSHTHFKDAKTFTFNRIYEDGSCCWTGGTCADGRHQQCEDGWRLKKHTHTHTYTHTVYILLKCFACVGKTKPFEAFKRFSPFIRCQEFIVWPKFALLLLLPGEHQHPAKG